MYIVAFYNEDKSVNKYCIVATKQAAINTRVNIPLDDNVPVDFYENYDNYKVVINASDNTLATLQVITTANNGIKRKLGGSDLPGVSPYKNLTEEIAGEVTNVTPAQRAAAIVDLPWASERLNTLVSLKVL